MLNTTNEVCFMCGTEHHLDETADGRYICKDCRVEHDFCYCDSCSKLLPYDDCRVVNDGDTYCEECFDRMVDNGEIFYCDCCEEWHYDVEENLAHDANDNEIFICDDCRRTHYVECHFCGDLYPDAVMNDAIDYHGHTIMCCDDCYRDRTVVCDSCNETFVSDAIVFTEDGECLCHQCYDEEVQQVIKPYSYKPTPILIRGDNETSDKKYIYMGVELEYEHDSKTLCNNNAAKFNDVDGFYIKHDGSLTDGYEAVSHPHTLQAWHDKQSEMESIFDNIGGASQANEECGLHIHVSKSGMSDLHKVRFALFFHENEHHMIRLARRERSGWGKFKKYHDMEQVRYDVRGQSDRYEAVNWLPSRTVELRFFRSTTYLPDFYRALELAHAAYCFTKNQVSIATIRSGKSWECFKEYVAENKHRYGFLADFFA